MSCIVWICAVLSCRCYNLHGLSCCMLSHHATLHVMWFGSMLSSHWGIVWCEAMWSAGAAGNARVAEGDFNLSAYLPAGALSRAKSSPHLHIAEPKAKPETKPCACFKRFVLSSSNSMERYLTACHVSCHVVSVVWFAMLCSVHVQRFVF